MARQPSLGKWLPVALMVGVFAGASVLASLEIGKKFAPFGAPWVLFISWGLYFMAGAKVSRIHKYFFGLTGGIVFGWLTILVAGVFTNIFGSVLGLPLTVLVAATLIVLLELTSWYELAPAYFFNYAGYFAYVFGGFGGSPGGAFFKQAVFYWILSMVGLILGYITASLKKKIFDVERVPAEERQTVFDKERPTQ